MNSLVNGRTGHAHDLGDEASRFFMTAFDVRMPGFDNPAFHEGFLDPVLTPEARERGLVTIEGE